MKNCINNALQATKQISLYFINANSISPYILGYMLKLRENDSIEISVVVGNAGLYEFLQSIDFNKFFDIKIKEFVEWKIFILARIWARIYGVNPRIAPKINGI